MWIVVVGNVCDGFTFYGSFFDNLDAVDWAERNMKYDEWVVATLDTNID